MPIAGMTNRWLARLATQVLEAFPGQLSARRARARTIGNPVRADIAALPAAGAALRGPRAAARGCWCSAAARARSA